VARYTTTEYITHIAPPRLTCHLCSQPLLRRYAAQHTAACADAARRAARQATRQRILRAITTPAQVLLTTAMVIAGGIAAWAPWAWATSPTSPATLLSGSVAMLAGAVGGGLLLGAALAMTIEWFTS
jgi:hypothetical protein